MSHTINVENTAGPDRPALANADQLDRMELYSAGRLRRLQAGASVLPAETVESWHLVINGRIRIAHAADNEEVLAGVEVGQGSWVAPGPATLVAVAPTTLMEVGMATMDGLSDRNQLKASRSALQTLATAKAEVDGSVGKVLSELYGIRSVIRQSDERIASLLASPPVEAFLGEIPALPPSATLLLHSCDEVSMPEVVQAVKSDPALAGLVLKVSNSAAFQREVRIADIQRACLQLGYVRVYQLVLRNMVDKVMEVDRANAGLQDYAALVAAVSYEISLNALKRDTQTANTIGLLHHVGASALPLFARRQPQYAWLCDLLDPARLGARLLELWQLPARVVQAVACQNDPLVHPPDLIGDDARMDLAVLHTAQACVHYLTSAEGEFPGPFLEEYFALLKVPYKTCADFAERGLRTRLRRTLPDHLRSKLDRRCKEAEAETA